MFNSFEPVPLPAGGAEGWEKKQTERRKQKCISEYARIAVAPLILRNVAIVSRNGAANRSRKKGGRKMAKFTFTGLDSIQYQLQARGAKVSGTVNHMLHAGAKIAREEMQAALKEKEIRDTGDLIKSIKASKIKKGDSGKYITIRPTGYDRHGVPNALKGYVYEIGTSCGRFFKRK